MMRSGRPTVRGGRGFVLIQMDYGVLPRWMTAFGGRFKPGQACPGLVPSPARAENGGLRGRPQSRMSPTSRSNEDRQEIAAIVVVFTEIADADGHFTTNGRRGQTQAPPRGSAMSNPSRTTEDLTRRKS